MNEQQALKEMAKHTKQNPAVGIGHHETIKTRAVKDDDIDERELLVALAFGIVFAVYAIVAIFGARLAAIVGG